MEKYEFQQRLQIVQILYKNLRFLLLCQLYVRLHQFPFVKIVEIDETIFIINKMHKISITDVKNMKRSFSRHFCPKPIDWLYS